MATTCTLLIVDDCAEDREVCRRYLLKDPQQTYQILEADSAEKGLMLCQEQSCDAILLDFCLPTMNGLEFLNALKQRQPETPVPVILLTGYGAQEVAVQAMKLGVQDYLIKQQLNPDMLQLTVRNVIHHWQTQLQLDKAEQQRRIVNTIALHMQQSLNVEQVLRTAVTEIQQLLECDRIAVYRALFSEVHLSAPLIGWLKAAEAGLNLDAETDQLDQWLDAFMRLKLSPEAAEPLSPAVNFPWQHASSTTHATIAETNRHKLILPIVMQAENGVTLWGVLVAQQAALRQWSPDEVNILQALVQQLAKALQPAEQFSQMQAALEQAKQFSFFKSQMVATVSHEYRNPLTAILAAASTLKLHREQLDASQQQHFLATIEDKARFMARLVEDLLVLEKLELGKVRFKPLPFNLLDFVAELVEEHRWLAGNQYEFIFQISGNTKGFWGDPDLLRQILVNLLSNAIKYSPEGGKIEIHLTGNESHLIFSIRDQGMGIPLADQETLFQSFNRGSNVQTIVGTGLGLAITKACIELHGGEIELDSIEEVGTTATVRLPKGLRSGMD
jgi:signal transduction histidine kinase